MPHAHPARSLLSVRPGETVEIHQILFDSIRDECARAGLAVGDALTGRGRSDRAIAVETRSGVVVDVDRAAARFVQIETRGDHASSSPRGAHYS